MLAADRQRDILTQLQARGALRVAELTARFGVAEETVRRDLRRLSEQGKLRRAHGGAVRMDAGPGTGSGEAGGSRGALPGGDVELPHNERRHVHAQAKRAIASAALPLIEPGQVIALDASTTAFELARQLPDVPLTVVTNSLVTCLLLAQRKHIETVCTGGVLDEDSGAFTGFAAERCVRSLNIQRVFFSCRGIDVARGLSEVSDNHARMKLCLIESAAESVLLADASKFGVASTVFFAPATRPDRLITNHDDSPAAREAIALLKSRNMLITIPAPGNAPGNTPQTAEKPASASISGTARPLSLRDIVGAPA